MNLFPLGVIVGFSQSVFVVSEESGSVAICAELLAGELETEVSVLLETMNDTGKY